MLVKGLIKNDFKKVVLRKYLKDGMEFNLNKLVVGKEFWKDRMEFQKEGPPKRMQKCET